MSENDREQVMCEDCGQTSAVCTVAVMMGTRVMHRRLCQACMAKASMSIATGNLSQVLGAIMAAARGAAQQHQPEAAHAPAPAPKPAPEPAMPEVSGDAEVCPQCGTTAADFRKARRLGCAGCAAAFRKTLLAALQQMGAGTEHTGRRPMASEAAQRDRAWRESLQRQLDEAIAREDYETAATLRDALRDGQGGRGDA